MEETVDRKRKIDETDHSDLADNDKRRHLANHSEEDGIDQAQTGQVLAADPEAVVAPNASNAQLTASEGTEVQVPDENGNEDNEEEYSRQERTNIPYDRLIVLEFEATCDDNPSNPASVQVTKTLLLPQENSEIIEFSYIILDASRLSVMHKEQIYVRPERTPLTSFCTEVTGITWDKLEEAGSLRDAVRQLDQYVEKELDGKGLTFAFVTHGAWDLRIQLPRESRDKSIDLPDYLAYCCMFDLKQEYLRWQLHHPDKSLPVVSLSEMCDKFQITPPEEDHSAMNDCLTMVEIIRYFCDSNHKDIFVHPIDTNADHVQFKKEESKVIHLAGLPIEITQGELEAWFSASGLRPTIMWMIRPTENTKASGTGFILFASHGDAMRALSLNGRSLGNKTIEVSPSSDRVIDAAGTILVPFPLMVNKGRTQHRPGDWDCPNCSFHNFASRKHCFKCNAENPNASASGPAASAPMPINFTAGDWMCPNTSCGFHNYASRQQCFKCNTQRPGSSHTPAPYHGQDSHSGGPSAGYGGGSGGGGGRPPPNFRPGDWICPNPSCSFQNFASRASCFRCHTPCPNPSPQNNSYGSSGSAMGNPNVGHGGGSYGYEPTGYGSGAGHGGHGGGGGGYDSHNYYGGGRGSHGGHGGHGGGGGGGGYDSQNYYGGGQGGGSGNGGDHGYGYGYGGDGGSRGGHQGGGARPVDAPFRPGDWMCPTCSLHNFASRYQCFRCGAGRPTNA